MAEHDDLDLALSLADLADELTLQGLGRSLAWGPKQDGTPVSEIDRGVEEALSHAIRRARPDDGILGEESLGPPGEPRGDRLARRWIIDPIDQTRHYLRGNPEFATLIALEVGGEPVLGVVSAPALRARWWAVRGGGAWRDGKRIRVSPLSAMEDAHLAIAGLREWHARWTWEDMARLLSRCAYPAGCAGGFLPMMLLAEGALDVFLEPWGEIWDHLGPSLIIQEAGGRATTLQGGPPRGGSLLASNGLLHGEVLPYLVPARSE